MARYESYLEKSKKYLMFTFTGIVVLGTVYNMFCMPTIDPPKRKQTKTVKKPNTVNDWTRKEMFQFLAKVSLYQPIYMFVSY